MSDLQILTKPLVIMFEQDDKIVCHLWPRETDTYEGYGLIICDLIRHTADYFGVSENDVFEWVRREHYKHTTEITRPS